MQRPLTAADANRLVDILAQAASDSPVMPQDYFRNLVRSADLPPKWVQTIGGTFTGAANVDARKLVTWAVGQGGNTNDPRFTTLGSLVTAALPTLGLENARWMAAAIVAYGLYNDAELTETLIRDYGIPVPEQAPPATRELAGPFSEHGPDIAWVGATDAVVLQSFLRPAPMFLDVGFLARGIQRAASVCRIELAAGTVFGTGFLVAPSLVLTNCHVLQASDGGDLESNAHAASFQFGRIGTAAGPTLRAVQGTAVVESSARNRLDYVLVRLDDAGHALGDANPPVRFAGVLPTTGMPINILQHARGEAMRMACSSNAVVTVLGNRLVQYTTLAQGGSSGSPCFDDNWDLVALHHAEQSRAFGVVREGIVFAAIQQEIARHL